MTCKRYRGCQSPGGSGCLRVKKHKKRGELQGIFTRFGVKNMKYMCCCLAFSILACEKDEAGGFRADKYEKDEAGGFRAGKYVCSVR